ncbi:hypothetical protein WG936_08150 [Corynebacterium sp. H127]|uniref:hypothetical protein n=1 Tax=Corynebacterium sp. H127 TaxID=3133418 RepID=UPI00309F9055
MHPQAKLHVVTGPPAAGKSTFIREYAGPDDVVIDFDFIANALSGRPVDNHDHSRHVVTVAKAARRAALDKALLQPVTTWIIHSSPAESTLQSYRRMGAEVHVIDPGKQVVMSRCKAERPPEMLKVAAAWYSSRKKPPLTTTEKGLGWEHQKARDALLAVHQDGTPCWWCAKPMFRDKRRNHDGLSLAADHEEARHYGGTKPTRLLHGSCNSSRKQGDNDDQRPAAGVTEAFRAALTTLIDSPAAEAQAPPAPVFNWPGFE